MTWGTAVAAITHIIVAVIREVVHSTVVTDVDGDMPGCGPGPQQLGVCMREGDDSDCGYLVLAVATALSLGSGRGVLVLGVSRARAG